MLATAMTSNASVSQSVTASLSKEKSPTSNEQHRRKQLAKHLPRAKTQRKTRRARELKRKKSLLRSRNALTRRRLRGRSESASYRRSGTSLTRRRDTSDITKTSSKSHALRCRTSSSSIVLRNYRLS